MSEQKIGNLKDDIRALEQQLLEKQKELQEEEQLAKQSRNDKLEQFAQDFIDVLTFSPWLKPGDSVYYTL